MLFLENDAFLAVSSVEKSAKVCLKLFPKYLVYHAAGIRRQDVFEIVVGSGSAASASVSVLAVAAVLCQFFFVSYLPKQFRTAPNLFEVVFEQVSNSDRVFMGEEDTWKHVAVWFKR